MEFDKWFHSQSKLIQIVLLLIPFVNWICEVLVRLSAALRSKSMLHLVWAIVVLFLGLVIGWVDMIWILLFNKMLLE